MKFYSLTLKYSNIHVAIFMKSLPSSFFHFHRFIEWHPLALNFEWRFSWLILEAKSINFAKSDLF